MKHLPESEREQQRCGGLRIPSNSRTGGYRTMPLEGPRGVVPGSGSLVIHQQFYQTVCPVLDGAIGYTEMASPCRLALAQLASNVETGAVPSTASALLRRGAPPQEGEVVGTDLARSLQLVAAGGLASSTAATWRRIVQGLGRVVVSSLWLISPDTERSLRTYYDDLSWPRSTNPSASRVCSWDAESSRF